MLLNIFVMKFVLLIILLGNPSSSSALQAGNSLLWIDNEDATVRLVDLTDPLSEVCRLPKYPTSKGPVTLASYDPTGEVVACGEDGNIANKDCYSFDGITWEPMPPLQEDHYPYAFKTKSFFLDGSLWVGGDDGSQGMVNEMLNSDGQWITLPVVSPYENYYFTPCVVPLNSSHIFFSGGSYNDNYLADTWILDVENLSWTSSTQMLTPRIYHGCVLTNDGEVLIAGGNNDEDLSSVHIYNPTSLEWRESGTLPPSLVHKALPRLLLEARTSESLKVSNWDFLENLNPGI